ncbi:MAG: ribonuclease HII [Bdellovibrionota bacterium]
MKKTYEAFDWKSLLEDGPIIGVDEVGRGCLAGRVYAAACILNLKKDHMHYTDSKLLSEKRRLEYSEQIKRDHQFCIAYAEVDEIDELNILHASLLAMKRAVDGLQVGMGTVLVDGNKTITNLDTAYQQITLVKGDLRAQPVAAAAILAKVERDRYISELGDQFPNYGFATHKAYPTKVHKEAIASFGPSPVHRKSFKGVKEFL